MKITKSDGVFNQNALEAIEWFENLLGDFDRVVLDLKGDRESPPVQNFKSLLRTQSEAIIQHLKILSAAFNISSLFSSHSRLNEVLSLIVESVKEVLSFSRVIILLLNNDRTLLESKIIVGLNADQTQRALTKPLFLNRHDCLETKVARSGESFLIKDINEPGLTDIDRKIYACMEKGSTIYVPITSKNGVIGVLAVDRQPYLLHPLGVEDVDRVKIFANYIGVLIENAKLYESILEHKTRFENIVQQSPNGIIITSPTDEIRLINQACEKFLGIAKEDYLARDLHQLLGTKLTKKMKRALNTHDRVELYDQFFVLRGGPTVILNLSASRIRTEDGSELLILLQDITERKMIDDHLQRLDKLATIGTMAAGIAHEIRNPLTSISMDLDALYECASDKQRVQETILHALTEIERTDKIISNLLQFSRPSVEEFVSFELIALLTDTISFARKNASGKTIEFESDFPLEQLQITGNPDRVKQMVLNLLINAVDAIESTGTITVQAGLVDERHQYVSEALKYSFFRKHRNIARIGIRDTGHGIPEEIKKKIFDPYFTTKSHGTGLGLAIVSKIVDEHHGYISFSSEQGEGTLFEVFFPAEKES